MFALVLISSGVLSLVGFLSWFRRRKSVRFSRDRIRRGTGHSMMGLQEFIAPSVEYVIKAENAEPMPSNDDEGDDPKRPRRVPPPFRTWDE